MDPSNPSKRFVFTNRWTRMIPPKGTCHTCASIYLNFSPISFTFQCAISITYRCHIRWWLIKSKLPSQQQQQHCISEPRRQTIANIFNLHKFDIGTRTLRSGARLYITRKIARIREIRKDACNAYLCWRELILVHSPLKTVLFKPRTPRIPLSLPYFPTQFAVLQTYKEQDAKGFRL